MKIPTQEIRPSDRPRTVRRSRLAVAGVVGFALSLGSFSPAPAEAAPVIYGNVDDIVSVDASDCPGCSPNELDVLVRGVEMMLREMRGAPTPFFADEAPLCTIEASMAKDMAVLAFDAYRAGAISEMRWRDALRAKAEVVGTLGDQTIDAFLDDYVSRLEERLGVELMPGSIRDVQTRIYASWQLARIFERMAYGEWQSTWLPALSEPLAGIDPVVDAVVSQRWRGRGLFDRIAIFGRPFALWVEFETNLLGDLRDDFLVGSIAADRDQLVSDYASAAFAEPWGVMGYGCGLLAADGFRRRAVELGGGYELSDPPGAGRQPTPWIVVDRYPIPTPWIVVDRYPIPTPWIVIDRYPAESPVVIVDVYEPRAEKFSIVDPDPFPMFPFTLLEPPERRSGGGGGGHRPPSPGTPQVPPGTPEGPLVPLPPAGPTSGGQPPIHPCAPLCPGNATMVDLPAMNDYGYGEYGGTSSICVCLP